MEVRSVQTVIKALNDADVVYLIVGGVAVNAHGFVRLTRDLNLVLGLKGDNALRGLSTLLSAGYKLAVPVTPEEFADPAQREAWRREKGLMVLKLWSDEHRRTPIDVFIFEPFDVEAELARAPGFDVGEGLTARVVSLATLLEMKRSAGRPQDLTDIEELTRLQ